MSNVLIDESTMVSIADAIRDKTNAGKMLPSEMPLVIRQKLIGCTQITMPANTSSFTIESNAKKDSIEAISIDVLGDFLDSAGTQYVGSLIYRTNKFSDGNYAISTYSNWGNVANKKISTDIVTDADDGLKINLDGLVLKANVKYAVVIYPKGV